MDAKYYCETMQPETDRNQGPDLFGVARNGQDCQSARNRSWPRIPEMYGWSTVFTAKLDKLKSDCPVDWSADKAEIEADKNHLTEKIRPLGFAAYCGRICWWIKIVFSVHATAVLGQSLPKGRLSFT